MSQRESRRDAQRYSQRESHTPVPYRSVPGRTGPFRVVYANQIQTVTDVTRDTPTLGIGSEL